MERAIFLSQICHKKVPVSFRWTCGGKKAEAEINTTQAEILPGILPAYCMFACILPVHCLFACILPAHFSLLVSC